MTPGNITRRGLLGALAASAGAVAGGAERFSGPRSRDPRAATNTGRVRLVASGVDSDVALYLGPRGTGFVNLSTEAAL